VEIPLKELLRPELAELSSYVPELPPGIEIRLDANEAPPARSPAVREVVTRAVAGVALERYPDARGAALKAAIAARTGAREDELLLGSGSDEVIGLVVNALARPRRGTQPALLAFSPTFVMYRVTAKAHGFRVVEVPLDAEWDLDVGQARRALDFAPPNIVFIATPNNPTGNAMSASRVEEIVQAASGAFVVLDEAYVEYARTSIRELRARYSNVGVLRTLSKVGLAALRVGWLEADAALVRELDKGRQPFNVSATSQAAAAAVMRGASGEVRADVEAVAAERERLARELSALPGWEPTPSDANFVWVRTPRPSGEIWSALAARGVLVRSFDRGGGRLARQLRVTVGTPAENDRFLEAARACA